MKVLQINSVCGIGSTGRIATDIHKTLIEQGHESYIAYGRGLPKSCDNTIKIGTKIDNYAHVAKTRILDKHGFGSRKATIEFIEKVQNLDPDVIHLHNIHGYYINIEILFDYLKQSNKPVIWTLHDCWAFTGHCAHFDYIGCDRWKAGCYDCQQKMEYPKSFLIDSSKYNYLNKRDSFIGVEKLTIITPSKWLACLVEKSFLKEYPIEVINNGIDLNVFKPRESNFRKKHDLENKYIILGVASMWGERKGFKQFLELSKKTKSDEMIVLVGLTEKQKKQLPKNILGIERTNNAIELAEIYTASDIFVNPTLEDNFPTVNIEAMACGIPVITYDVGGSSECIDSTCGDIIKKEDINQLYSAIQRYKNNKDAKKASLLKSKIYDKRALYFEYLYYYSKLAGGE